MLPSMKEAEKEIARAGELNPGLWIEHSINVCLLYTSRCV